MAVDTVHVWTIWLQLPPSGVAALERLLDGEELRRAGNLRPERRRRFVVTHAATRAIVGERLGAPPRSLRWRRGPHGKPELTGEWTGVRVNLSHSGEVALLAVSATRAVGVDVQELRALDASRMSARFFPPEEACFVAAAGGPLARVGRFTRLWTRKEACVKGAGGRLMQGMALPVQAARRSGVLVRDPALPGPYLVRDVPAPDGFRAAVAMAGAEPFRITRRLWSP